LVQKFPVHEPSAIRHASLHITVADAHVLFARHKSAVMRKCLPPLFSHTQPTEQSEFFVHARPAGSVPPLHGLPPLPPPHPASAIAVANAVANAHRRIIVPSSAWLRAA
jgi:hypothetical protein